ncbi:MAG: leucyl/phenylalanyl-tRNA--protein transferase [Opitutales bacterium]
MAEWDRGDPARGPASRPLATGGTLDVDSLKAAYRAGVFPWYSHGEPVQWWCPDPRFVMRPADARISASLRRTLREAAWEVSCDRDFEGVMRACAEQPRPGQSGTWITEEMVAAYCGLHRAGLAHSVEVRRGGQLVGGLYGVALGTVFHGESMFHREKDASKVAFAHLVSRLEASGFRLIDCQVPTRHLASLGAFAVSREAFLAALRSWRDERPPGDPWISPPGPA